MPAFAGLDMYAHPGDAVMSWLLANTNLVWTGYYLAPSPSHGDKTWMGTRAGLQAAGWGIAPIYVGQQVIRPGSLNPSTATGTADGQQAAALMASEGFAGGSCVYLDLENGPPIPQALQDYTTAWCDAVSAGGYLPGIYCSHTFAIDVHTLRPAARIWAFKVETNTPHPVPNPFPDPHPSGCGYVGSYIWQLGQNCRLALTLPTVTSLSADLSTAIMVDPGAPD